MIAATRGWFRRNRTNIAIGAGVLGSAYLAGQYVLGKITEARRRMGEDRSARENLQIRFRQNQEDCTYTVLALLPTAADAVGKALPVEDILGELQARKTERVVRGGLGSTGSSEVAPSEIGTEEGSVGTGSFIHASQQIQRPDGSEAGEFRGPRRDVLQGKSKVLLWEDLKITSVTRALTLLYTLPLLTLLTRIQLNLLGRRTYLSSVVALASPQPNVQQNPFNQSPSNQPSTISLEDNDAERSDYYGADLETNRKYLTFSWWLLHTGWQSIKSEVEMAVRGVFGPLSARESLTFDRLAEMILAVRKTVEGKDEDERRERRWLRFLLPPKDEEEQMLRESGMFPSASSPGLDDVPAPVNEAITPSLRRLLDETSDLIDSPTFSHVLTLLLDSAFSLLVEEKVAMDAFKMPSQKDRPAASASLFSGSESRIVDITEADPESASSSARLATVLAVFTKQALAVGRGGEESIQAIESASIDLASGAPGPRITGQIDGLAHANEYLSAISSVRDLEAFAAVVYSSNFEFEGLNDENDSRDEAAKSVPRAEDIETSLVEVGADSGETLEAAWMKSVATKER